MATNGNSNEVATEIGMSARKKKQTRKRSWPRVPRSKRSRRPISSTILPPLPTTLSPSAALPFNPGHPGPGSSSTELLPFPFAPVPLCEPIKEIDLKSLKFLLEKKLKVSDANSMSRIVIPKKEAETFLPKIDIKEGKIMKMKDADGLRTWSFRYRFWPNKSSRMYVLENTGSFISAHKLQVGDFAMLYKDEQTDSYVIRGRKASDPGGDFEDKKSCIHEANNKNPPNLMVKPNNVNIVSPIMPEEITSTSFFYDTTFPSEYEPLDPLPDIGSLDSFSLDDFF